MPFCVKSTFTVDTFSRLYLAHLEYLDVTLKGGLLHIIEYFFYIATSTE